MIADTAFQANSPWLCDLSTDGFGDANSASGVDVGKSGLDNDLFETWELDDSELLPEGAITDLAALLNNDADEDDDDVCLQTISSSDLDLLSTSVLSFIEESRVEIDFFSPLDDQSLLNDAASIAASTSSGYSSGCESCISNEDTTQSIFQRLSHSSPRVLASDLSDKRIHGRRKKQRKSEGKTARAGNKKWSSMSDEDQRQVIKEFTQVISSQLGMRERLEAIHIINPHAKVSPTDTEFYIDISPINNGRFASLQKFVRLHTGHMAKHSTAESISHSQRRQEMESTFSSAYVSDHLVMCAKSKGRKKKGRSSRREQKALCQQLSKEAIQRIKEEQSGFFMHEVRIAVSSSLVDDDDDDDGNIDILE